MCMIRLLSTPALVLLLAAALVTACASSDGFPDTEECRMIRDEIKATKDALPIWIASCGFNTESQRASCVQMVLFFSLGVIADDNGCEDPPAVQW